MNVIHEQTNQGTREGPERTATAAVSKEHTYVIGTTQDDQLQWFRLDYFLALSKPSLPPAWRVFPSRRLSLKIAIVLPLLLRTARRI